MITLRDVANDITVEEMAALSEPYEDEILAVVEGMLHSTPPDKLFELFLDLMSSILALGRKMEMSRKPISVVESRPNEN